MGNQVTRTDFEWTDQEEPHAKRRMEILKKYPQIKKLFGVDPMFKWKVVFLVLLQFVMVQVLKDMSWPIVILTAYIFGGVINHALMLGWWKISIVKLEYLFYNL